MKKYEVKVFDVEAKQKPITISEKEAWAAWDEKINQTMELKKEFLTLDEAVGYYNNLTLDKPREMGCGVRYILLQGKVIEINEYNEDGEWIDGGDFYKAEIRVLGEDDD